MYRAFRMKKRLDATRRPALLPSDARRPRSRRPVSWLPAAGLVLLLFSCQSADPVQAEKERILGPDERYLVEYYMKIIEFEKQEFDDEALRADKKREIEEQFDRARISRALAALENKPERWLAIYSRINELQAGARPPTEPR
jgi:hypothetical protein